MHKNYKRVKISFGKKQLEDYATDEKKRIKKLGPLRAGLYKQRLDDLYAATTLEEVRYLPGHYHELVGNRKGQWACDLDQPYRLIFTPTAHPIPTDPNGKYIWIEIDSIEIEEIDNYHGK